MNNKQSTPIIDAGWIFRHHNTGESQNTRLCVMLHGWTGDETSMDIFLRAFPAGYLVISPRGPIAADEGGYGWVSYRPGTIAPFPHYQAAAHNLSLLLERWIGQQNLPDNKISVVGFSQGAAMALSYAVTFPERVDRVACISGFLPQIDLPAAQTISLSGVKVFITHGTKDTIIPIERAHEAAAWLEAARADISSCQADVGHRLSANCFRKLKEFLR